MARVNIMRLIMNLIVKLSKYSIKSIIVKQNRCKPQTFQFNDNDMCVHTFYIQVTSET